MKALRYAKRLVGFDSTSHLSNRLISKYLEMKLIDFKLDKANLLDRRVEVKGNLAVFGSMAMLRNGPLDGEPVFIETNGLPREQRKQILQKCDLQGCRATVRGKTGSVFVQVGIIAEQVLVR